jgi:peptidoglycan/xylan/chitin deacetylase (PgdA/CDA1 family)
MAAPTIVLYHAIAGAETDFEKGLDVLTPPKVFEKHLNYFSKEYDIVDLSTVLSGKMPRRPLLITFDDYYRSVLDVAQSHLKPRGIPAVFFVNSNLVGRDTTSLDNAIAFCVNTVGAAAVCECLGLNTSAASSVGGILQALASRSANERRDARDRLLRRWMPPETILARRLPVLEREHLALLPPLGVELGNHTASHISGRSLRAEEINAELVESREHLEVMSGSHVRSFSLPYGREADLTPPVLKALRDSGHEAIFLVQARSNAFRRDEDVWYRVSLHSERTSALPRKLTWLPLVRSLKDRFLQ